MMKLIYTNTKYPYLRAFDVKTGAVMSADPHPMAQATNIAFYEFEFEPVGEAEIAVGYVVPVAQLPIGEDGQKGVVLIALGTADGIEVDASMMPTGRKAHYSYERRNGAFVDWMEVRA